MGKGRPKGALEARPCVIGNGWYVRLYTTARKTADGKFVPVTSAGKIAHDDDGKIIRRQFNFRLGDVGKFKAKGAGLGLAVAQIKADIERAEQAIGLNVETERPDDMLVSKFFTDVFMPHARQEKELSTVQTYERYWSAYLSEHFNGTKTLKTYQPHTATDFLESLCRQKRSENTVRHCRNISSAIFAYATAKGYCDRNPWRDAKKTATGKETEEGVAYTERQIETIVDALSTATFEREGRARFTADTAEMAVIVGFYCGLRPSELAGLTWDCVNIGTNSIVIRQAHVSGVMKGTKTGKERTVCIPAALATTLNGRLRWWRSKRPADGWVFPGEMGRRPVNMAYLGGFVGDVLKKVGMEFEGFYACRRGFGTRMMLMGLTPVELAQAMGNSVPVIMKHYFKDKDCKLAADGMLRIADIESRRQLALEGK
jgi:integrase